jgi:hypothetical protein
MLDQPVLHRLNWSGAGDRIAVNAGGPNEESALAGTDQMLGGLTASLAPSASCKEPGSTPVSGTYRGRLRRPPSLLDGAARRSRAHPLPPPERIALHSCATGAILCSVTQLQGLARLSTWDVRVR